MFQHDVNRGIVSIMIPGTSAPYSLHPCCVYHTEYLGTLTMEG